MVAKNKATTGKGQIKKLKLKRETIKDLDAKGKSREIKGGAARQGTFVCPTKDEYCVTPVGCCSTF